MLDIRKSNLLYIPLRWKVRRQPLKKKKKSNCAEIQKLQHFFVPWTWEPSHHTSHGQVSAEAQQLGCTTGWSQRWMQQLGTVNWSRGMSWATGPGAGQLVGGWQMLGLASRCRKMTRLCASCTQDAPPFALDDRDRLMSKSLMMADLTNLYIHSYR